MKRRVAGEEQVDNQAEREDVLFACGGVCASSSNDILCTNTHTNTNATSITYY